MAAMRKPAGSVSAFLSSRLERVRAVDDSIPAQAKLQEYCNLVDDAIDRRGFADSLFRHTPDLLRVTNSTVFSIKTRSDDLQISSALHIAQNQDEETFWINGLVKSEGASSLVVHELLAHSIGDTANIWGNDIKFRACYRVFPEGYVGRDGRSYKINKGSARIFEAFCFEEVEEEELLINGTVQDAHLIPSAEADGKSYVVKIVESTDETIWYARNFIELLSLGSGRA